MEFKIRGSVLGNITFKAEESAKDLRESNGSAGADKNKASVLGSSVVNQKKCLPGKKFNNLKKSHSKSHSKSHLLIFNPLISVKREKPKKKYTNEYANKTAANKPDKILNDKLSQTLLYILKRGPQNATARNITTVSCSRCLKKNNSDASALLAAKGKNKCNSVKCSPNRLKENKSYKKLLSKYIKPIRTSIEKKQKEKRVINYKLNKLSDDLNDKISNIVSGHSFNSHMQLANSLSKNNLEIERRKNILTEKEIYKLFDEKQRFESHLRQIYKDTLFKNIERDNIYGEIIASKKHIKNLEISIGKLSEEKRKLKNSINLLYKNISKLRVSQGLLTHKTKNSAMGSMKDLFENIVNSNN